jgi:hypothetical protein
MDKLQRLVCSLPALRRVAEAAELLANTCAARLSQIALIARICALLQ